MNKTPTPQERLEKIVDTAYEILCGKVASGSITIENEAALQLQFSVILEQLGRLYELALDDRFSISLEEVVILSQKTTKSPRDARCDIVLKLQNALIAIELNCILEWGFTPNLQTAEQIEKAELSATTYWYPLNIQGNKSLLTDRDALKALTRLRKNAIKI